jgi:hypothetical protein
MVSNEVLAAMEHADAAETAWRYGRAVGATFARVPSDPPQALYQPDASKPAELLAYLLSFLTNYQVAVAELPSLRSEAAAWTKALNALQDAFAASRAATEIARSFPRRWDSSKMEESAKRLEAQAHEHLRLLEQAAGSVDDLWALPDIERDRTVLWDVRFWLMQAFKDAEVAELLDDGVGGSRTERIDRIKKARRKERSSFANARVPYEKGLVGAVHGPRDEAKTSGEQ